MWNGTTASRIMSVLPLDHEDIGDSYEDHSDRNGFMMFSKLQQTMVFSMQDLPVDVWLWNKNATSCLLCLKIKHTQTLFDLIN